MKKRSFSQTQILKTGVASIVFIILGAFIFTMFSEQLGFSSSEDVYELTRLPKSIKTQLPTSPQPPTASPAPPAPTPSPIRTSVEVSSQKTQLPSNPEAQYYLQPGKLTTPGDALRQVKIQPISPGELKEGQTPIPPSIDQFEFNMVRGILQYVRNFDKFKEDEGFIICHQNNVNDVFTNGVGKDSKAEKTCCIDYAHLFVTLARLYGIPAKFVWGYYTDWSAEQIAQGCWDGSSAGHAYAQVYINGIWYLTNPQGGTFSDTMENSIFVGEGRDMGDIERYNNRACHIGLNYGAALSKYGLILCTDRDKQTSEELIFMLACSKPLQPLFEFQQKGEK